MTNSNTPVLTTPKTVYFVTLDKFFVANESQILRDSSRAMYASHSSEAAMTFGIELGVKYLLLSRNKLYWHVGMNETATLRHTDAERSLFPTSDDRNSRKCAKIVVQKMHTRSYYNQLRAQLNVLSFFVKGLIATPLNAGIYHEAQSRVLKLAAYHMLPLGVIDMSALFHVTSTMGAAPYTTAGKETFETLISYLRVALTTKGGLNNKMELPNDDSGI